MSFPEALRISPELALVDPELAAAERARLPLPHEFRPGWRTQPAVALFVETEPLPQVEVEVNEADEWAFEPELPIEEALWAAVQSSRRRRSQPAPDASPAEDERVGTTVISLPPSLASLRAEPVRIFRSRARRRRALVTRLALIGVAGAAAGVAVADRGTDVPPNHVGEAVGVAVRGSTTQQPTVSRAPTTHTAHRHATPKRLPPASHRVTPVSPAPTALGPTTTRTRTVQPQALPIAPKPTPTTKLRPAATPRIVPAPKPVPHTTTSRKPSIGAPAASAPFVPSRTWSWSPVAGAETYRFSFARNGRVVFATSVGAARLQLPGTFVFHPGRYMWLVVPVVGGTPRSAIVRSTFTIG